LAPIAEQQLDALADYVAERSGEARAEAYVSRIVAYCRGFKTFPHRGTRCDHISPGLRIIGFERRVTIAFRVLAEEVVIAQILYGGQDIDAAFDTD
jgi:toxin ParE1/3/4